MKTMMISSLTSSTSRVVTRVIAPLSNTFTAGSADRTLPLAVQPAFITAVVALLTACSSVPTAQLPGLAAADIVSDQTTFTTSQDTDIVWIRQPLSLPGPVVAKVHTSPVTVTRLFDAQPYDPAHVAVGQQIPSGVPDNLSDWVQVSGNYTPKGIYTRPDPGSRILTRVAPGARLRLEDLFDGWMKVDTGQGIGYLQAIDARILSARNDAGPRVIHKQQNTSL